MDSFHTLLETNKPMYNDKGVLIRSHVGMIPTNEPRALIPMDDWVGYIYCTNLVSIYDLVSKWTMLTYSQRY